MGAGRGGAILPGRLPLEPRLRAAGLAPTPQQAGRLSHRPLRLEATYWSAPVIAPGLPAAWMLGRSNIVGVRRNMQLVQDRVVDGWLAGLPDLPNGDHPTLTAIVLSRMPVFFTCADFPSTFHSPPATPW